MGSTKANTAATGKGGAAMALIYRAIWQDQPQQLLAHAERELVEWLRTQKRLPAELLDFGLPDGEATLDVEASHFGNDAGTVTIETSRAATESVEALRSRVIEHRPDAGERWTTTLTVLVPTGPGAEPGSIWVDIERESRDPFARVPLRSPLLVRNLIERGVDPRVGHIRLEKTPAAMPGVPLAALVRRADRRLPLVVFAHDRDGIDVTMRRSRAAFVRLAGVAQICLLPPDQEAAFNEALPDGLGVWNGAARLYLPVSTDGALRGARHRYVEARRMFADATAGDVFAEILSATVTATPPPAAYELVRRALHGVGASRDELEDRDQAIERLIESVNLLEEEKLELLVANEDLEKETNLVRDSLAKSAAATPGVTTDDNVYVLPGTVDSIQEAVGIAQRLTGLVIDPDAPQELDTCDSALEGQSWANAAWRALRALDAYANARGQTAGGFYQWCQNPTSQWSWTANSKKLAMSESESTMNAFGSTRNFPVSTKVDPSGRIVMQAHIKVAEGGGDNIPRIYFYDDTDGTTGKVHVGFIGPHHLVPNRSRS
jgi:hypothetical protein